MLNSVTLQVLTVKQTSN